jgi:hypothetical protein
VARIVTSCGPGCSRPCGKLKLPSAPLTTVVEMVLPARLAVTSTPSMRPSRSEVTDPASADGTAWAFICDAGQTATTSSAAANAQINDAVVLIEILRVSAGAADRAPGGPKITS